MRGDVGLKKSPRRPSHAPPRSGEAAISLAVPVIGLGAIISSSREAASVIKIMVVGDCRMASHKRFPTTQASAQLPAPRLYSHTIHWPHGIPAIPAHHAVTSLPITPPSSCQIRTDSTHSQSYHDTAMVTVLRASTHEAHTQALHSRCANFVTPNP
jgi:hypothetical protein